ncbi:hypothetical protein [Dyadobacter sp. CY326]|uniref:hypothetical protein n=1 Tax=Dyadobacter sp. CY326 TaxID=2907300 RepID=UPI001F188CE4|nr:hypothetical protein [Dyadobacter sp. CY326]MCE7068115.1 hypothetical protein [Dyadobacter sp. CY326]
MLIIYSIFDNAYMHIAMIVGVSGVMLFVLFLVWSYVAASRKASKIKEILDFGIESEATVLATISIRNQRKRSIVNLRVQVEPLSGRNYVTDIEAFRYEKDKSFRSGDKILVKYLLAKPKDLVLVKVIKQY